MAGLPPAGPAERKREPIHFSADGEPEIVGELVVQDNGFDLHAKTCAGALDDEARARLLRYILRPPLAQERLAVLPDHRIRLTLKRPWSDGTYAFEMDALALLARLASAVPPPRQHQTRYAGVATPPPPTTEPAHSKPGKPRPTGDRCRYIRWATLLRLTFGLTVDKCPVCGGDMKLRALVRDPESIERFLRHENLWSPPPTPSSARAPPYDRSVTRLQPTGQQELLPET